MDNRERSRRDFSLGFTVPTVVLPNVINVTSEEDEVSVEPSHEEPPAPRPKPKQDPASATKEVVRPSEPPAWFNAVATKEITITDRDGQTVFTVPVSGQVRVFLPVRDDEGVQTATVHAFADDLCSIATGVAVVADAEGFKIGDVKL